MEDALATFVASNPWAVITVPSIVVGFVAIMVIRAVLTPRPDGLGLVAKAVDALQATVANNTEVMQDVKTCLAVQSKQLDTHSDVLTRILENTARRR